MPTSSSRRPFSRGEKWLFGVASAAILGLVGAGALSARLNQSAEIVFPAPIPLPNPNGFDVYLAAATMITSARPAVDPVNDTRDLRRENPRLAAQNYSLARRNAWLASNAAGFALFRQATTLPCRHPHYQVTAGTGNYAILRELARKKIIEANTLKLRGDWNGSVVSALDILQMGSDMGNGAPLMGKLTGSAILAIGRDPLTAGDDPISKLSAPQALAATKRLEAVLKRRSSYADILENDRWHLLQWFDWVRQQKNWRKDMMGTDLPFNEKWEAYTISQGEIIAAINRGADESIADAKKPFGAPFSVSSPSNPLAKGFVHSRSYRHDEAREIVPLNVLLLRLALQTYKAQNGRFPATLNALSPSIIAQIPTDYYADGAPFRYRITNGDYELWSVGPDGKDDGGKPIKWRDGKAGVNKFGRFPTLMFDSKGDYVARRNR